MRGDPHAMEGFEAWRPNARACGSGIASTGGAGGVAGALLNRDIFRDQYVVDPNEEKLRSRCARARRTRPGSGS